MEENTEKKEVKKEGESGLDVFLKRLSSILSIRGLLAVCLAVVFSVCVYLSMTSFTADGTQIPVPEAVITLFSCVVMSFFRSDGSSK